jgi:hypothetical protein
MMQICNYMHYATLNKMFFFFLKNHTFIPNKILNILSKTKEMIISTALYFK